VPAAPETATPATPANSATPAAVPAGLAQISARTDARIAALLQAELTRWGAVDSDLVAPLSALRDLVLAGGKRIRPAFCHWAFVGAGGDFDDPVVADAGAALELLHTFALVHDDVMDDAATRRSIDTVHVRFEADHAASGWRGEGRRFGEGVAILVGDLAFVYADQLLASSNPTARAVFGELRVELNVGQYLDLVGTVRGGVSEERARLICRYKAGKYTVERPLHLGAALAGRLDDLGPALSAYGLPLGEAFQLRDDLLGAFGDATVTGKPVGQDLREGKPTALYAIAIRRAADDAALGRALDRYGDAGLSASDIADLQRTLVACGAVVEVETAIDELLAQALAAVGTMEDLKVAPEARAAFVDLARYATSRDR